jgi:hypothetical protein
VTPRPVRPPYVPDTYEYVPWPHGADLTPVEHRRRLPRRTRTAILMLIGVILGALVLAVLAAAGTPDDPERIPPPAPTAALAGDIVWGRHR